MKKVSVSLAWLAALALQSCLARITFKLTHSTTTRVEQQQQTPHTLKNVQYVSKSKQNSSQNYTSIVTLPTYTTSIFFNNIFQFQIDQNSPYPLKKIEVSSHYKSTSIAAYSNFSQQSYFLTNSNPRNIELKQIEKNIQESDI